jgi:hypothetical protein
MVESPRCVSSFTTSSKPRSLEWRSETRKEMRCHALLHSWRWRSPSVLQACFFGHFFRYHCFIYRNSPDIEGNSMKVERMPTCLEIEVFTALRFVTKTRIGRSSWGFAGRVQGTRARQLRTTARPRKAGADFEVMRPAVSALESSSVLQMQSKRLNGDWRRPGSTCGRPFLDNNAFRESCLPRASTFAQPVSQGLCRCLIAKRGLARLHCAVIQDRHRD